MELVSSFGVLFLSNYSMFWTHIWLFFGEENILFLFCAHKVYVLS